MTHPHPDTERIDAQERQSTARTGELLDWYDYYLSQWAEWISRPAASTGGEK